jgi:transposase InsO family protein
VLTDNGREFCGTDKHPYELYLDLNGIEHRRTKVRSPKTNGFVERFNGTVLDEFFRVKMRETFYDSVEAPQADLDLWLRHSDTTTPRGPTSDTSTWAGGPRLIPLTQVRLYVVGVVHRIGLRFCGDCLA